MERVQVIEGFIRSLAAQDASAAERFLSPDFGIQGGDDRLGFLNWELEQFAERAELLAGGMNVAAVREVQGGLVVGMFDRRGWLLAEEEYHFAADGLIGGNQRLFDVVAKLHFSFGSDSVLRAVSVPRPHAVHARVLDARAIDQRVGSSPVDGGLTLKFALQGDDYSTLMLPVRVVSKDAASTSVVEFRGLRNEFFVPNMFATAVGGDVFVPSDRMNVWCLTVVFEDGSCVEVSHPSERVYRYEKPVAHVTLTDALDNDWEWSAEHAHA